MDDIAIATIAKGDDELRIAVKEYEGHVYTDVRLFVDYTTGGKGPSKKGVVHVGGRLGSKTSFKRPKRNPVTGEIEEGA